MGTAASFFFSIIICSNLLTYLFCAAMQIPPGNSTKPLGVQVLESRGQFAEAYWYWIGVGALVGYIIIFNIGFTLAIAFMPGELIHTPLPHNPNGSRSIPLQEDQCSLYLLGTRFTRCTQ
jgi:hypothetical protein